MRPMLAMPGRRVPAGADWVHEVKWDGMRVLADVAGGRVTLTSRTERDVTVAFPELAGLAEQFEDMLLDGEIVAMRAGIPSFAALAERFHVTSHRRAVTLAAQNPATLMAFDLLRLYGVDLTQRSLADRRSTLERLELAGPHWQVPPTSRRRRSCCATRPAPRASRGSSASGCRRGTTRACAARSG